MKRTGLTVVLVLIVLALLGAVGYTMVRRGGAVFGGNSVVKDSGDNISDYTAVFLTNGQVYFGKMISSSNDKVVDLRDIYYLQVNQQIQPDQKDAKATTDEKQPEIVLVKLGEELHGPNNRMLINRDQVLFTESMKKDAKVIKAIEDYQNKK